jgi:hypothetical protein
MAMESRLKKCNLVWKRFFFLLVFAAMMLSCSTYPHRALLKTIKPGMSRGQLADTLGEHEKTKAIGRHYWVKYYLADDAAVCTAHYFIFDSDNRLVKWEEDKEDEIVDKNDVMMHLLKPFFIP